MVPNEELIAYIQILLVTLEGHQLSSFKSDLEKALWTHGLAEVMFERYQALRQPPVTKWGG